MSTKRRSLMIPSLVYLGAAVLVGIPAMAASMTVLSFVVGRVLELAGIHQLPPVGGLLLVVASIAIGLQIAVEIAAVQLGGLEALERGSPRVALVRYALFTAFAFAALAAATWAGLSAALGGFGWGVVALGLLVGGAGVVVLYRGSRVLVAGFRRSRA
ncbi:hypothetical protein C491_20841 [Natronococcus amylolyticus DSM 10524]|uniref:Uncharacterized protein n=1 Tax=Natronococcus amylolyticus DSM 10524 TaxID=1227497 RepID=L9WWF3_9EURY|nr:hypothetical protein [Natronococcus amylolyticus]ELY53795.1 hypothetical protein C491_20841 [Natronococcus amylolyticus DSM 10524]